MRTWLEVNFRQMYKNLTAVRNVLPEGCRIIAVVKANAYGHGDIQVAQKLESFGIDCFAVACTDEAMTLRRAGITSDIIILGYTEIKDAPMAAENRLTLTCVGPQHLSELSAAMEGRPEELLVHLAINTGMNRIGFDCRTDEQLQAIADAYSTANLNVCGIFSHFSSADDTSSGADEYTNLQLSRYESVLDCLRKKGIDPGLKHISNSGGIGKYPMARFDAVRCGALLYGYNTAMDAKMRVSPVMEWKTRVTCVRTIDKGDSVSYSRRFTAERPTRIATLGVGYADGLTRALSNRGCVLICGQRAPILGNMCMDQMMIDISGITSPVEPGTEAVIIGHSGNLVQTADDIAETAGTCMHEVLSTIGLRVERYYK